jgi:hypothetical protein
MHRIFLFFFLFTSSSALAQTDLLPVIHRLDTFPAGVKMVTRVEFQASIEGSDTTWTETQTLVTRYSRTREIMYYRTSNLNRTLEEDSVWYDRSGVRWSRGGSRNRYTRKTIFDAKGRPVEYQQVLNNDTTSVYYSYDEKGRRVSMESHSRNVDRRVEYIFDAHGNHTATHVSVRAKQTETWKRETDSAFYYDNQKRLSAWSDHNYTDEGELTYSDSTILVYDYRGLLVQERYISGKGPGGYTSDYLYNGNEQLTGEKLWEISDAGDSELVATRKFSWDDYHFLEYQYSFDSNGEQIQEETWTTVYRNGLPVESIFFDGEVLRKYTWVYRYW